VAPVGMLNTSRQARSVNEILRYGECQVEDPAERLVRLTRRQIASTYDCTQCEQNPDSRRHIRTRRPMPAPGRQAGGHARENTKSLAFGATRLSSVKRRK
jgi:hypothetical protein